MMNRAKKKIIRRLIAWLIAFAAHGIFLLAGL